MLNISTEFSLFKLFPWYIVSMIVYIFYILNYVRKIRLKNKTIKLYMHRNMDSWQYKQFDNDYGQTK